MHRLSIQILRASFLAAVLFAGSIAVSAQTAISGRNAFYPQWSETTDLPNGHKLIRTHGSGFGLGSEGSPFALTNLNCRGTIHASAEGVPQSMTGHCDAIDAEGDTWAAWYAGDGTTGKWGFMGGSGKFDGVEGGGTYKMEAQWSDGKWTSTWEGSYKLSM